MQFGWCRSAEAAGFEPARGLPPYTLSRRAPSSARAGLRGKCTEAPGADRPGPSGRVDPDVTSDHTVATMRGAATEDGLRIGELAGRTGLTVRALHHYDRIGLLSPSRRTEAGYRLYGEADVRRLYAIV